MPDEVSGAGSVDPDDPHRPLGARRRIGRLGHPGIQWRDRPARGPCAQRRGTDPPMKLRLSLAGALLLSPALGLLTAAPAGAAESSVAADFDCTSVTVSSSRYDLSNVVLRFADGDQKFDGL